MPVSFMFVCEENNVKNFISSRMKIFSARRRESYPLKKGMWRKVSENVSYRDSKYEADDFNNVDVIGFFIIIIVAVFIISLLDMFRGVESIWLNALAIGKSI